MLHEAEIWRFVKQNCCVKNLNYMIAYYVISGTPWEPYKFEINNDLKLLTPVQEFTLNWVPARICSNIKIYTQFR